MLVTTLSKHYKFKAKCESVHYKYYLVMSILYYVVVIDALRSYFFEPLLISNESIRYKYHKIKFITKHIKNIFNYALTTKLAVSLSTSNYIFHNKLIDFKDSNILVLTYLPLKTPF